MTRGKKTTFFIVIVALSLVSGYLFAIKGFANNVYSITPEIKPQAQIVELDESPALKVEEILRENFSDIQEGVIYPEPAKSLPLPVKSFHFTHGGSDVYVGLYSAGQGELVAFTSGRYVWDGRSRLVSTLRHGDIFILSTGQTSKEVASSVMSKLHNLCETVQPSSNGQDSQRNPYASDGKGQYTTLHTVTATIEVDSSHVEPIKLYPQDYIEAIFKEKLSRGAKIASKPSGEIPTFEETEPQRPRVSTQLHIPTLEGHGPGCGWKFWRLTPPKEYVSTQQNRNLIKETTNTLNKDVSEYNSAMKEYAKSVEAFNKKAEPWKAWQESVLSAKVEPLELSKEQ